jgi:hypothetical protein
MYANVVRGFALVVSAMAIFVSGMAVGSAGRLSGFNPVAAILSKMTEPAVGAELVVPHKYACSTCTGKEHFVHTAEGFDPVRGSGPYCMLYEGDTIRIAGKTRTLVVAELIQQVPGAVDGDGCKMNQALVFDQDDWQWFLDDIARTKEAAKVKEELKPYTT